jgi:hypothetical protein
VRLTPSYYLKFQRAEEHFDLIEPLILRYVDAHPYLVSMGVEDENHCSFRYVHFTNEPSDLIAVVAGDVIHNLRSGLNHLAAACTTSNHWRRVQFPIFDSDPFQKDRKTLPQEIIFRRGNGLVSSGIATRPE